MPADPDDAFTSRPRGCLLLVVAFPLIGLANIYRWLRRGPTNWLAAGPRRERSTGPWWRRVTHALALPIALAHHVLYDDVGNRFSSSYKSRLTGRPVRHTPALMVFTAVYLALMLGLMAAIGLLIYRLVV